MTSPSDAEIRWRAWAAGVFGLRIRQRPDGSVELIYADEIATASTIEQADAYLRFWQAQQAMRAAGCAGPPQKIDPPDAVPQFRLEPTRLAAHHRQLRLFSGRG
jgi:hypothetical protein